MKKILLIGDSIRVGYDKYVKMAFEGEAEVYFPAENCRFAAYVTRCLHEWRDKLKLGEDLDLIHWNAGLWDDLILLDGEHFTPLPVYEMYIERACKMMNRFFPKAKMIFATSTPVKEELFTTCKRYNKDTEAYNLAAVNIVTRYGGVINDLYSEVKAAPKSYYSDLTHLYTKGGTKLLTEKVVSAIENELSIKGKELDYDALFAKTDKIVGI